MPIDISTNQLNNVGANVLTYGNIVTDGLVLYLDAGIANSYPGSGTTWTDMTSGANNGTLINGPTYSTNNGGYIIFDGTDDRVEVANESNFDFTNAIFTVECFFRCVAGTGTSQILINKARYGVNGRCWELYLTSGLAINFGTFNTSWTYLGASWTYSTPISTGQWYHLVVSCNSSNAYMYLNASQVDSRNSMNSTVANIADPVEIGGYSGGAALNGYIPLARIYNKALSASEVLQNFNANRRRFNI